MRYKHFLNNNVKSKKAISSSILITIIVIAIIAIAVGVYFYYHSVSTTSKVVTITYFDDLAPSEAKVMESVVIPMFEKMYPNIKINYVDESASQIVQSVEALEQSGKVGPVIIGEDNMIIGELIYGGYLMNLTPIASQIMPSSLIPSMAKLTNYELKVWHAIYFIPLRANILSYSIIRKF